MLWATNTATQFRTIRDTTAPQERLKDLDNMGIMMLLATHPYVTGSKLMVLGGGDLCSRCDRDRNPDRAAAAGGGTRPSGAPSGSLPQARRAAVIDLQHGTYTWRPA